MHSYEDRMRAVTLYIKLGKRVQATIRELGYPSKNTLRGWYRKQTTLWQIVHRDQDAETVHGTQKPVECMRCPILNNSSPGQAVYEPFMGSGTTLIATETTGHVCDGSN
jgi:DNA modification methylase